MQNTFDTGRPAVDAAAICFGLDRATDEASLKLFLERFSAPELLGPFLPRLSDSEILALADFLTGLLRKHLTGEEYHRLFLKD